MRFFSLYYLKIKKSIIFYLFLLFGQTSGIIYAILPCICTPDYDGAKSIYKGMPQLKVSGGKRYTFFTPFCPKCGRGGLIEYKSAYLALKAWNEMQEMLRKYDTKQKVLTKKNNVIQYRSREYLFLFCLK